MKLWQKYLLFRFVSTFAFFFFCIVIAYLAIDLSIQGTKYLFSSFYLYQLSTFLDLFLSLSFLLSALRVLFDFTANRELLALQMGGVSKKRVLLPLFAVAISLFGLSHLNHRYLLPDTQVKSLEIKGKGEPLHIAHLIDGSTLVYQKEEQNRLLDVFWVKSDAIWHMKSLDLQKKRGEGIDCFSRGKKIEKIETQTLPDMAVKPEEKSDSFVYHQILVALLPLLTLIFLSPFCLKMERTRPTFLISSCAIFLFLSLKIMLEGMLILSEEMLPSMILFMPVAVFALFFTPPFLKMR
jgi:hypothetical protein